jgi:hypothetical protein
MTVLVAAAMRGRRGMSSAHEEPALTWSLSLTA